MREFFKGWRRKFGVVTLVIACVFMGGWIRTNISSNQIHIQLDDTHYLLMSTGKHIRVTRYRWSLGVQKRSEKLWSSWPASWPVSDSFAETEVEWRWSWGGFDFGEGRLNGTVPMKVWAAPHWSVLLPLILLSGYLLLSKPRPKKPPEST